MKTFDTLNWMPSEHFVNERLDRYLDIVQSKGFGSYFTIENDRGDSYECITNTGVLVILSKPMPNGKQLLVTAYAPTHDKVFALYSACGYDRVPHWMMEKVTEWEWLRQKDAKRKKALERRNEFETFKKNRKRG